VSNRNHRPPRRCTAKDIQLVVLQATDVDAALVTIKNLDPSMAVLRTAAKALADAGGSIDILEEFVTAYGWPPLVPVRGRCNPRLGETRAYKTQRVKQPDGDLSPPFIRLPIGTLGISDDGVLVVATFRENYIQVAKPTSP
jgi:hypothetical protein